MVATLTDGRCQKSALTKTPPLQQSKDSIFYQFSDSVKAGLLRGIAWNRKHALNEVSASGFYILLGDLQNGEWLLTINSGSDSEITPLIESTSRFSILKEGLVIPVISDYDMFFASLFRHKDEKNRGLVTQITIGGYTITSNLAGEIIYEGFQQ